VDLHPVLHFLNERGFRGERTVLVTVCAVEGSSMRNPGTIMGIAEDGGFAGSLSGGCIENAVVAEALDVLKADTSRVVRFGAGSPYLDLKLPCGGGLDIHFQPLNGSEFAKQALAAIAARQPFSIALGPNQATVVPGWSKTAFDLQSCIGTFGHWPAAKLLIVGHGAGVEALSGLACQLDCEVAVLTPDGRMHAQLEAQAIDVKRLERTTQTEMLRSDPWTAIVFLFHDHDWEIDLMARAFELPHFYLGAMGGRKAHAMRSEALIARGITAQQLSTIHAPVGVFHSSRDPQTLALSTLAQIIRTYQETDFEAARG